VGENAAATLAAAVFAGKNVQCGLKRVLGPAWPDPEGRVRALTCRHELLNLNLSSFSNQRAVRRGTRIPCEIPITLTSLDPIHPFSEPCLAILVNPQGCAVRLRRPLEIGAAVRLEGLPVRTNITARVVNSISLGEYEKFWLLGLALDEPGNVWGIKTPPEDWAQ
jgi:hypothetical protein